MAVELTEEEKKKLNDYLKEVGFENANPVEFIKGLNAEAKTNREKAAALDTDLKAVKTEMQKLVDAETARVAKQKEIDDEAAKKQKALDDEKKTLDQRLADLREEIANQFKDATKAQQAEMKALTKELETSRGEIAKRDQTILTRTVRAAAEKRGIIDGDLVQYLDLKDIKMVNGEPDVEAIGKMLDAHAELKPMLYKDAATLQREQRGNPSTVVDAFNRPVPDRAAAGVKDGVNYATLSDADFDKQEAELRAVRV